MSERVLVLVWIVYTLNVTILATITWFWFIR